MGAAAKRVRFAADDIQHEETLTTEAEAAEADVEAAEVAAAVVDVAAASKAAEATEAEAAPKAAEVEPVYSTIAVAPVAAALPIEVEQPACVASSSQHESLLAAETEQEEVWNALKLLQSAHAIEIQPAHAIELQTAHALELQSAHAMLAAVEEDKAEAAQQAQDLELKLRMNLTVQQEKVTVQQEHSSAQQEKLTVQQEKITEQDDKLAVQEQQLTVQQEKISVQQEQLTVQQEQISKQQEQISEQQEQLAVQQDHLTNGDRAAQEMQSRHEQQVYVLTSEVHKAKQQSAAATAQLQQHQIAAATAHEQQQRVAADTQAWLNNRIRSLEQQIEAAPTTQLAHTPETITALVAKEDTSASKLQAAERAFEELKVRHAEQLTVQQEKISEQQERITVQEDKLTGQQKKISEQEEKITVQEEKLSVQEELTVEIEAMRANHLEELGEAMQASRSFADQAFAQMRATHAQQIDQQKQAAAIEKQQLKSTISSQCDQLAEGLQLLGAAREHNQQLKTQVETAIAFGTKHEKANESLVATIDLLM